MRVLAFVLLLAPVGAQVTYDRLVNAKSEPQNWLTYWGDYSAIRYRELKQIDTTNVHNLRLEWIFQTGEPGRFQTVPLVDDGVMYLTAPGGHGFAIDAHSGRELWHYKYPMPANVKLCCGTPNRGFAM